MRPCIPENLPAAQNENVVIPIEGQEEPTGQIEHNERPGAEEKEPAKQRLHVVALVLAPNEPNAQGTGAERPVMLQNVLTGHG